MDILHSNWLIQMLKKSGNTPQARLLSLFDILNDWLEAPGISKQFNAGTYEDASALKAYLSIESAKAGAALPEMLATQLHIMAMSAMQEKLMGDNQASLIHAKSAAEALISVQTKKEFHISRSHAYTIAASFLGALVIVGSMWAINKPTSQLAMTNVTGSPISKFKPAIGNEMATPQSTAALVSQIEQMRSGNCRLIEAIQLPDKYKAVYFKNIIAGQISTNPDEQAVVRELLQQIQCNYTPMLMKKST
jgi:hypothetical protein